jgi:hypothetical protein
VASFLHVHLLQSVEVIVCMFEFYVLSTNETRVLQRMMRMALRFFDIEWSDKYVFICFEVQR